MDIIKAVYTNGIQLCIETSDGTIKIDSGPETHKILDEAQNMIDSPILDFVLTDDYCRLDYFSNNLARARYIEFFHNGHARPSDIASAEAKANQ